MRKQAKATPFTGGITVFARFYLGCSYHNTVAGFGHVIIHAGLISGPVMAILGMTSQNEVDHDYPNFPVSVDATLTSGYAAGDDRARNDPTLIDAAGKITIEFINPAGEGVLYTSE